MNNIFLTILLLFGPLVSNNIYANRYSDFSNINSGHIVRRRQLYTNSFSEGICGTSIIPPNLIFGAIKTKPGTWPWLAAIFKKTVTQQYKYLCSGNIIAPHAILTAAHCIIGKKGIRRPRNIFIGLGLFEIYRWNEPNTYIANVYSLIPHPDYGRSTKTYDADIAIIILDRSYAYNHRVRPICMWSGAIELIHIINEQGYVAGWGGVSKIRDRSDQLPNIIKTVVIGTNRCRNSNIVLRDLISNRNFCAASYLNSHGPCKGDSGSGLMIQRGGRWYLRGIVSGTIGHIKKICDINEYVVYTDVAKFIRWIQAYLTF